MAEMRIAYALTGSFCTFRQTFQQMEKLVRDGFDVTAILSYHAASTDTRFYKAQEVHDEILRITGKKALTTLPEVEPIGPKNLADAYIIAPCTGASMCKMAGGIFDTPALLGAKSCLRNSKPVLLCPATNDGLSTSAAAIGKLLGTRGIYFVPFGQDDPVHKPRSLVAHFDKLPEALAAALAGAQMQPILV